MGTTARKPVASSDVALVLSLPVYFILSWLAPEPTWRGICDAANGIRKRFSKTNPLVEKVSDLLPDAMVDAEPETIVRELETGRREHYFQVFREYRPGGWTPDVEVEGLQHLEEAKAAGRGVVLWIDHFVFNGLLPKKVLSERGYPYTHLSRPEHGFSKTRFGVRFLNPLRSNVEDRYLKARVLIERDAEARSVRSLVRLLKQGEIVSITAGAWEGRRTVKAEVFGHGYPLATGAPSIAFATESALIPVAVFRCSTSGTFRIQLDAPIFPASLGSKSKAIDDALDAYARHLEPLVRAYPGQWRGWQYLEKKG